MDWKEYFDKTFQDFIFEENQPYYLRGSIRGFIKTEVIEKLIEEIPTSGHITYDHDHIPLNDIFGAIKERLKAKWLK